MSMTREQIKSEAMQLAPNERELLAEELMFSISPEEADEIDKSWREELDRRDELLRQGKLKTRPIEEVLDRLTRKAAR
jgi:putative addiction module component (TIGR02574 family)